MRLQELDDRVVPAVITVTSLADNTDVDGMVTLREAILSANANSDLNADVVASGIYGNDTIQFNIDGVGLLSIELLSALPAITDAVTIDGYSQSGTSPNSLAVGNNAVIRIELNGQNAGVGANGLEITSAGSTVAGLIINRFHGSGIYLNGSAATDNHIFGNFIGTTASNESFFGNANGIRIVNGSTNTIGGTIPSHRNILSGNWAAGVLFESADNNEVLGNYIGTDSFGTTAVGNFFSGVLIKANSTGNKIGGIVAGAGNLISGNLNQGVEIIGSSANLIAGNYIGMQVGGFNGISNSVSGVRIADGAVNNVIGGAYGMGIGLLGTDAFAGNLISGNRSHGVLITGMGTTGNQLFGNLIGTDRTGLAARPNGTSGTGAGVRVELAASSNTIGDSVVNRNVISAHPSSNIQLTNAGTTDNLVAGNRIGTNAMGTGALPGTANGIIIEDGASNNTIGGTGGIAGAGNLISGNQGSGITITGAETSNNGIYGNYLGTTLDGNSNLGNRSNGILILSGASGNRIGDVGKGNLISGNGSSGDGHGINVSFASENIIRSNRIGVNASGTAAIGNLAHGIYFREGATKNIIGGSTLSEGNLVSGNGLAGILFGNMSGTVTGNLVAGNVIGLNLAGNAKLGNGRDGVILTPGSHNNIIGVNGAGSIGNIVAGNLRSGMWIENSNHNRIAGNLIGTNAAGMSGLGNVEAAITIFSASTGTIVGGLTSAERNVISGNVAEGIFLDLSATSTSIQGNFIGVAPDGVTPLGNGGVGISLRSTTSNTIGGTAAGAGNVIAYNSKGVVVGRNSADTGTIANSILGNSIYGNTGLGIDLANDGATLNGVNPRAFPNNGQNFPVITSATRSSVSTKITGTLTSVPNSVYRLEFFATATNAPLGQTYVGFVDVITDSAGFATYSFLTTDPAARVIGNRISATATGSAGTSEFSSAATLTTDVAPTPTISSNAAATVFGPFPVTVRFSEAVTDFDATDLVIVNGNVRNFVAVSSTEYTFLLAPIVSGLVTVDIPAGAANDSFPQPSIAASQFSRQADVVRPTVTIEQATNQLDPTNALPIRFTVVFSENVTGFDKADVVVIDSNGRTPTTVVTGSGSTYEVSISGLTGQGNVQVSIRENAAVNAAGNPNFGSTSVDNRVTYDFVRPTATITSNAPLNTTTTQPIIFTIVFSEGVFGLDESDLSVSGTAPGTPTFIVRGSGAAYSVEVSGLTGAGTVTLSLRDEAAIDPSGNRSQPASSAAVTYAPIVPPLPPVGPNGRPTQLVGFPEFAVGSGFGDPSQVKIYGPDGQLLQIRDPFPGLTGGVRTAVGDFNADGISDFVVGTGPGGTALVKILNGVDGSELFEILPFESFNGGVYVAAGDFDGDGRSDLVISPDEGGGPRVRVFRGGDFTQLADFFGIEDPDFRGGVRVSVADVTGDGIADLLVAAGFGGGPRLAGFDGASLRPGQTPTKPFSDFFVFEPTLRNGVFVTGGDLDGDGFAEIIVGGGPGGGPRVFAVSGRELVQNQQSVEIANFFAGNVDSRGGIRVAVKDLDGDSLADLVVGSGLNAGSDVTGYLGETITQSDPPLFWVTSAFPGSNNGVFVG
ncbi:Ig-like domain-containing protein [Tuwongella immobilis]|nr:Ig-like domain-containing protein [Tuwongella immobilis]